MRETVHEVSFPAIAGFPASHLESHINHLLFETDMNQREHTSHGQRPSTDIMTETESGSGTLLNNQQPDLQKIHSSRLTECRWHVGFLWLLLPKWRQISSLVNELSILKNSWCLNYSLKQDTSKQSILNTRIMKIKHLDSIQLCAIWDTAVSTGGQWLGWQGHKHLGLAGKLPRTHHQR